MFSRLVQVTRHLSPSFSLSARMAGSLERNARTISTAACLIIGDEVLGGKVGREREQRVLMQFLLER